MTYSDFGSPLFSFPDYGMGGLGALLDPIDLFDYSIPSWTIDSAAPSLTYNVGGGPALQSYSLGVPGIDEQPMRPSIIDISQPREATLWERITGTEPPRVTAHGFQGADGPETLEGRPFPRPNAFGDPESGIAGFNRDLASGGSPALARFLDALKNGSSLLGGDRGEAPGLAAINAPKFESAQAPTIPRQPVPAVPTPPPPVPTEAPAPFRPMVVDATAGVRPPAPERRVPSSLDGELFPNTRSRLAADAERSALTGLARLLA